jgi:hypothetical protein
MFKIFHGPALFIVAVLSSNIGFTVGGYYQLIIVNNQTDHQLALDCAGGANVRRQKSIDVPAHRATVFLADALVEPFSNLLGGSYQCKMSVGPLQDHRFSLNLENGQEIAIWTLKQDFASSGSFICNAEGYNNFGRPHEIIYEINHGFPYEGPSCAPINF